MNNIKSNTCWCGKNHIEICKIHGTQKWYHDEGGCEREDRDGNIISEWEIYRCIICEEVSSSWSDMANQEYRDQEPIRAVVAIYTHNFF